MIKYYNKKTGREHRPKLYKIKRTGEIFTTNYIDHFNWFISVGDYKNGKILPFNDVIEIDIK